MASETNPEHSGTVLPPSRPQFEPHPTATPTRERRPPHRAHVPVGARLQGPGTATALGWLSVGLGLGALLAPRALSRAIGMPQRESLLRVVGVRELTSGVGLLTQKNPSPWLWSRVLGDAMDLALMTTAFRRGNSGRHRAINTVAALSVIAAVDLAAGLQHQRRGQSRVVEREDVVEHAFTINRSTRECYDYWRDLTNLPRFIRMLHSITIRDERISHWVLRIPGGATLEWDSELTVDRPGESLSWRSLEGSPVSHSGSVRFESAPGGRGCIVWAVMHYSPPLGNAVPGLAKLMSLNLNSEMREDLRRFKQLIESGEIPTTDGQPSGRRSWFGRLSREGRQSRAGTILKEQTT